MDSWGCVIALDEDEPEVAMLAFSGVNAGSSRTTWSV
jgi:phosphotransacetylase